MFSNYDVPEPRDELLRRCSAQKRQAWGEGDASLAKVARAVLGRRVQTAAQLRPAQELLSFGCAELDEALGGGIRTGMVTEVYGEAGTGKTHLALQLALVAQLPRELGGLDADTIYLATEPPFNAQRLFGILQKNMGPLAHLRDGENDLSGPGSRVLGLIVDNLDTQTHILRYQLPNLLGSGRPYSRVKLLILDSVTANFRGEYTASDKKGMADRGAELFDLGAELKSLADRFGLCVVVTNQVTGAMQPTNSSDGPWAEESSKPSLGLAWSNVVNTRLRLGKRRLPYAANLDPELPATGQSIMRHISVDFAPNLSKGSGCLFEIYEGGIRGCPNQ